MSNHDKQLNFNVEYHFHEALLYKQTLEAMDTFMPLWNGSLLFNNAVTWQQSTEQTNITQESTDTLQPWALNRLQAAASFSSFCASAHKMYPFFVLQDDFLWLIQLHQYGWEQWGVFLPFCLPNHDVFEN